MLTFLKKNFPFSVVTNIMPETLNLPNSSFYQASTHLCLITFPLSPHPSPSPVDSCWLKQWLRCLLLTRRLIVASDPGTIWIFTLTQTEKASFFFHINTNLILLLLLSGNSQEQAVPGRNKAAWKQTNVWSRILCWMHLSNSTFEPVLIYSASLFFPFCFNS